MRHHQKPPLTIRIDVVTYRLKCLQRDQSCSVAQSGKISTANFSILPRHFVITARFLGAGSSHFTSSSNFTATPETWRIVHGTICAKGGMDVAWGTLFLFGPPCTIHESAHTCVFFFDWSLFFHFPDPFLPTHVLQSKSVAKNMTKQCLNKLLKTIKSYKTVVPVHCIHCSQTLRLHRASQAQNGRELPQQQFWRFPSPLNPDLTPSLFQTRPESVDG